MTTNAKIKNIFYLSLNELGPLDVVDKLNRIRYVIVVQLENLKSR